MLSQIGLIGLGVMGQNLVLNMERNGYRVAVYNRSSDKTRAFLEAHTDKALQGAYSLAELVSLLESPKRIMLMVPAGAPVDAMIDGLLEHLVPGDCLIDGGNSFFADTVRRAKRLEALGIHYLGAGVSGGEEGALKGPSIMPGGSPEAWALMGEALTKISAHVDGNPCCAYIGADGSGHYVKMTHNGIEYGDMQLIGEIYALMRGTLGMSAAECAEAFAEWNRGALDSYLIEITADILTRIDASSGQPLVDIILDSAGQKGTGKWTGQQALELGVAAPTIAGAVFARNLSGVKAQRVAAGALTLPAAALPERAQALRSLEQALYAAKICSYAQGFALMRKAAESYHWTLDYGNIALLWRGGCIIRAQFLSRIKEAYDRNPELENLLADPHFAAQMEAAQASLRAAVAWAAQSGVAAPCLMSALAYYDAYHTPTLRCASLIQAQRDYFGAHTYERIDEPGVAHHTEWL